MTRILSLVVYVSSSGWGWELKVVNDLVQLCIIYQREIGLQRKCKFWSYYCDLNPEEDLQCSASSFLRKRAKEIKPE